MAKLDFKTAFKYPFNRAAGMLNALWILLPIIGWFALGGYLVRIVQEFTKGKFKQLPEFKFANDLELGFWMFLKGLPFLLACILVMNILSLTPWIGGLVNVLIRIFVIPILTINFFNKQTVKSFFEFEILKSVLDNLGEYILVMLKSLLLGIIFFFMIIILVGIPASMFTQYIFIADFYKKYVK